MMWHNTGERRRLRGHRMPHIGNIDLFRLGGSDTQHTWQYYILLFIITSFDLIFGGIADRTLVSVFAFVCFIEYVYFKPIHLDFELNPHIFSIRMGQSGIDHRADRFYQCSKQFQFDDMNKYKRRQDSFDFQMRTECIVKRSDRSGQKFIHMLLRNL